MMLSVVCWQWLWRQTSLCKWILCMSVSVYILWRIATMKCKFLQKPNRKCQANLFRLRRSIFSAFLFLSYSMIYLFVCVFFFLSFSFLFFSLLFLRSHSRDLLLVHCTHQNSDNFGTMLFQLSGYTFSEQYRIPSLFFMRTLENGIVLIYSCE